MSGDGQADWYLREWMEHLQKRQADLANADPRWPKGRVSKFVNGVHPYRREVVNAFAAWLGIEPYELLMPPERALRLRRLEALIAAETGASSPSPAQPPRRTGTAG